LSERDVFNYQMPTADVASREFMTLGTAQQELQVASREARDGVASYYQVEHQFAATTFIFLSMRSVGYLERIFGASREATAVLESIRILVMTIYAGTLLYSSLKAIVDSEGAIQSAIATAEAIAYGAAQQWANIALALVAAAIVFASFSVGYGLGSGQFNFNDIDFGTSVGRESAKVELVGVTGR
jgi:hypothetical protein